MAHPSQVKPVIMTTAKNLGQAFDALLQSEKFRDYGPNGLQVEGDREVRLLVSGVTVAGNLADLWTRLERGSDLEFRGSFNSPSLMFDGIAIAGK